MESNHPAGSGEVIAYLTVTDYHEFVPLLSVSASSKDVMESDTMFRGVLSDLNDDFTCTNKEADKFKAENETKEVNEFTAEIAKLQENEADVVRRVLRTPNSG